MFAEEDKTVLDACDKWLQQAEALVIEADAKIEGIMHQDTGNLLAEEWVTFVHKYSMQIKDIEQVGQSACVNHWDCQVSSYVSLATWHSPTCLCLQCALEEQCCLTVFLLYPDTNFVLSKLIVR